MFWSLKERVKLKSIFLAALLCSLSWNAVVLKSLVIIPPHPPPFVYKPSQNPLRSRISPLLFSGSWRLFYNEEDAVKLLKHGVFWESNKAFLRLVSPLAVWFSFHDEHPCHFYVGEPLLFIRRLGSISTAAINLINNNSEWTAGRRKVLVNEKLIDYRTQDVVWIDLRAT